MKTNKQSFFWMIDVVLWISFLLLFFLELTGLDLHQWLGVAISAFAGYHLLLHANWVTSVTARLHKAAGRVRLNYLVDAVLILGFGLMLATGLVISTWFNLNLDNYAAWKDLHVGAAVGSLAVLAAKIGLHWRWIVQGGQRILDEIKLGINPRLALQPRTTANAISRRHFLTVLTMTGISAGVAATNVLAEDNPANAATPQPVTANSAATAGGASANKPAPAQGSAGNTDPGGRPARGAAGANGAPAAPGASGTTGAQAAPSAPSAAADTTGVPSTGSAAGPASASSGKAVPGTSGSTGTTGSTGSTGATGSTGSTGTTGSSSASKPATGTTGSTTGSTAATCRVRCNKGCSYPGKCRKYTDTNGNKKCDLGECM